MTHDRSGAYKRIVDRLATKYDDPNWDYAPLWRNRVGLRRLAAEAAASEAHNLLRDINRSTHRNQPEIDDLLLAAREAARAYSFAVARDNWDRLERKGEYAVVGSTPEGQTP